MQTNFKEMLITISSSPLDPLELPLTPLSLDWYGEESGPPLGFGFGLDPGNLHFRAVRAAPALIHPAARPGQFTAELWKYDVAEFFLAHPDHDAYLEFNLAPNGAWWSCLFSAPLERVSPDDAPLPGVVTRGVHTASGWEVSASLPLASLPEALDVGPRSRLNATFILDSPRQRFFTATPLGPGKPNFHQPSLFPSIEAR